MYRLIQEGGRAGQIACVLLLSALCGALQAQTLTALHFFSGANGDGAYPIAGLIQGRDGAFYGTTSSGGVNGTGVVYRITAAGALTTIHAFTAIPSGARTNADGAYPYAGLVLGSDGNFYGTTQRGGAKGNGTVFRMTPSGVLTTLHNFARLDGSDPTAGLVQGTDGSFYGTTQQGGAYGYGTVYRITSEGTLTTLHSFNSTDGAKPISGVVQGTDGAFYGTTWKGGAYGNGTAFKLTPDGVLTVLHAFSPLTSYSNADGANPEGGLVEGKDGSFYGTTRNGGAHTTGVVFRVSPTGVFTTLHTFMAKSGGPGSDGAYSYAGLIRGSDDNFYGTTFEGGIVGIYGTIFRITPDGTLTTLHSFAKSDGNHPWATPFQGTDGNLYGTTYYGGANGIGVVYRLSLTGS